MKVSPLFVCLVLGTAAFAEKTAAELSKEAARAERVGDLTRAYILYTEAAAKDPDNQLLWLHVQTLRPLAEPKLKRPKAVQPPKPEEATKIDTSILGTITDRDIEEARELLPPPQLQGAPGTQDFKLRGNAKQLFDQVASAFGLEAVYDTGYQPKSELRLDLTDVDYRDALRAVEAASESFLVPITAKRFLVANDSTQKRTELDRTAVVVVPALDPVTPQELQEVATGIRGTLDLQRLMVDTNRRLILIRDRATKVLLAQKLIEDLMRPKAQIAIEVELTEVSDTSSLNYGLSLPSSFALAWFGSNNTANFNTVYQPGFNAYLGFGGGKTLFGIGITSAGIFAIASKGHSTTLLKSEVVSSDGQAATLHVGDKYPIVTNGYFGAPTGGAQVYTPPPTVNFEDLGLVLKVTPYAHGTEDITLDVDAEFKLLGSTSVDNIPVISNRKFQSKVRLVDGQWAILAGLMSDSEARTISGIAGLSVIPVLRDNTKDKTRDEVMIVLKPHLLSLPPSEWATRAAWFGTETRPRPAL